MESEESRHGGRGFQRTKVQGFRCQVPEMIDLNTETLLFGICYLKFLLTGIRIWQK